MIPAVERLWPRPLAKAPRVRFLTVSGCEAHHHRRVWSSLARTRRPGRIAPTRVVPQVGALESSEGPEVSVSAALGRYHSPSRSVRGRHCTHGVRRSRDRAQEVPYVTHGVQRAPLTGRPRLAHPRASVALRRGTARCRLCRRSGRRQGGVAASPGARSPRSWRLRRFLCRLAVRERERGGIPRSGPEPVQRVHPVGERPLSAPRRGGPSRPAAPTRAPARR